MGRCTSTPAVPLKGTFRPTDNTGMFLHVVRNKDRMRLLETALELESAETDRPTDDEHGAEVLVVSRETARRFGIRPNI
jgi:hypothetical protein